ncbi:MAG: tRNA lysidine(34) synthetase TilS [Blastocatellia bacterium]
MMKLERKLKAALRQLGVGQTFSLVIAISGGADSVSLLDACVRLKKHGKLPGALFAVHLNHQLRGEESDGDEDFVQRLAAERGVELHIERIAVADVARAEKRNLEAVARRLRYEFLAQAAKRFNAAFVCTAHTLDDQAETIWMRLLRGTGAEGLHGIHPISPLSETAKLIRPMLSVTRAEVLAHCEHYNLDFRLDSSNLSRELTRNRIRQELIPLLKGFNQRSNETLVRSAKLISDDDDCLRQIAAEVLAKTRSGQKVNAKLLKQYHPAIRRRVLRMWVEETRGNLRRVGAVHIAALESLIECEEGGRVIELPGSWQVRRKHGVLEIAAMSE